MDKFTKFSSQKLIHLSIENFNLILEFETGRNRPVNRKKNNTGMQHHSGVYRMATKSFKICYNAAENPN
eukprot:UN22751